ncbi:hypothetical protein GCM10023186_22480 [Hymenobacter koreensis]|uniref:Glycosyltransferase RgtA/B/C/D-like domain-containing protein n=2 Tax=Hymenobacter koreensis TaxID=1084523 RepID=A0ABP8J090_9BACT
MLTAIRFVISLLLHTFDDIASYSSFVQEKLIVVASYYPVPNNHILSNTISWLFYQLYPGYWWSMRVPILLVSTIGTIGWFLGLLRLTNFRIAAIATGLFSFLELSLFYAAEGRGYALIFVCCSLGFFCSFSLAKSQAKHTVCWLGLLVVGILGLYAVPTFAYFLVAAYSWLGWQLCRKGESSRLISFALVGAATVLGAVLLYTPVLLVSGPRALVHNKFVQPLAMARFFKELPTYLFRVEGALLGESHNGVLASFHVGSFAAGLVVIGFLLLVYAARTGRLAEYQTKRVLSVGMASLWFLLVPYLLMIAQRVQAPDRAFLFKAAFMFVLVGIELDWLLHQYRAMGRRLPIVLGCGAGLWASVQLGQLYKSNQLRFSYASNAHAAAQWLLDQQPGPILSHSPGYITSTTQFFIVKQRPASALRIDETPRQGVRYRYLINPTSAGLHAEQTHLPSLHLPKTENAEAVTIVSLW